MRNILLILGILSLGSTGCSFMSKRASDFGDMWRMNLEIGGPGLEAGVKIGELADIGVGQKGVHRYGTTYMMQQESRDWAVIHLPLSLLQGIGKEPFALNYVYQLGDTRSDFVWWWQEPQSVQERSWLLLPSLTGTDSRDRIPLHWFDLEVSAFVLCFGLDFGFSFGEFVDFILGWFGLDIANDDSRENRSRRRLYTLPELEEKSSP
tara:strand:+ start:248 stop:868 length:621 start_codon:yes stop_codon:yes gene_type:complete